MLLVGMLLLVGIAQETAEQWLGDGGAALMLLSGGLIPARVFAGEWWRLLAATALHQSWTHLLVNTVGLLLLGRPIESAFGATRFWWVYFAAALAGSLASLSNAGAVSVGASGAVFGMLGAMVALGVRLWPRLTPGLQRSLVLMPAGVALALGLLGLMLDEVAGTTAVDHRAHLGGACGGFAAAMLLALRLRGLGGELLVPPRRPASPRIASALRVGAAVAAAFYLGSIARATLQLGAPPLIEPIGATTLTWRDRPLTVPTTVRTGVLRGNRCSGELVDVAWALDTDRIVCFELPLGGLLLLGRPTQMLSMDEADVEVMGRATATGGFVRRHRRAMLMPVAGELLFVLRGAEPLLDSYSRVLAPITPPPAGLPNAVTVDRALDQPAPRPQPVTPAGPRSRR